MADQFLTINNDKNYDASTHFDTVLFSAIVNANEIQDIVNLKVQITKNSNMKYTDRNGIMELNLPIVPTKNANLDDTINTLTSYVQTKLLALYSDLYNENKRLGRIPNFDSQKEAKKISTKMKFIETLAIYKDAMEKIKKSGVKADPWDKSIQNWDTLSEEIFRSYKNNYVTPFENKQKEPSNE